MSLISVNQRRSPVCLEPSMTVLGWGCFVWIPKLAITVKPSGLETWWYTSIATSAATTSFDICTFHTFALWMCVFLSWHGQFQKFLRSNSEISCAVFHWWAVGTCQSTVSEMFVQHKIKSYGHLLPSLLILHKTISCISGNVQKFDSSFLESFILSVGAMSPSQTWCGEK